MKYKPDSFYRAYVQKLTRTRLILFLALGLVAAPVVESADLALNPSAVFFHLFRFAIFGLTGLAFYLLKFRRTFSSGNLFFFGYFTFLLPSLFMSSYFLERQIGTELYDSGFYLILLSFSLVMPWDLKKSLSVFVSIYLISLASEWSRWHGDFPLLFLPRHLMKGSAILIASVAGYFQERLRFREFTSRSELTESKKEIEAAKNRIEEAYRELKESDKIKTDFFANVNHEIRTPLTLILLPLEMALNREYGELSPGLQKSMATVRTNALRLLNLINGLLDLAKTDAGKMELFQKKQDLKILVQGIVSSLSLIADRKNIKLTLTAKGPIPEFFFDREKIERTFINLISNALKFTDSEGKIDVSLEVNGDLLEARVSDSGIGIPESAFDKIFKRFVQMDSSTNRRYQGTGLGLTLCKEFVELHGGAIRVESRVNEGSTFIFTLPLRREAEEGDRRADRRAKENETRSKRRNEDLAKNLSIAALYESVELIYGGEHSGTLKRQEEGKKVILVVEEHFQLREFIRLSLEKEYDVITAGDGAEGLERVRSVLPDLVISDLMMPCMDGIQLCREMQAFSLTRHIPVILLTAKTDISLKMKALEEGVTEYISKPFYAEELLTRIRSIFKIKALEDETLRLKTMSGDVKKAIEILASLRERPAPESWIGRLQQVQNILESAARDAEKDRLPANSPSRFGSPHS